MTERTAGTSGNMTEPKHRREDDLADPYDDPQTRPMRERDLAQENAETSLDQPSDDVT